MTRGSRLRLRHGLQALMVLGGLCGLPTPGAGQLISPGKLAAVHSEAEGIRNCTLCHVFRQQGIEPLRCLDCHKPLAARLTARMGFHASLSEKDCAVCHKEHFGTDFALVRLDTLAFEHTRAGYELEGEHQNATCRACHVPERIADALVRSFKEENGGLERTFLGLPNDCASCHEEDAPHREQFSGRACTDCHDESGWEEADGFDHDLTEYRLTGAHRNADCSGCHETTSNGDSVPDFVQYEGVRVGTCTQCHADQHAGSMPGRCETCHNTSVWRDVDRSRVESSFDHEATSFSLVGRHAAAPCASCHLSESPAALTGVHITFQEGTRRDAFPKPQVGNCQACHTDQHQGAFAGVQDGGDCVECHGQESWLPAAYDVARHNREAGFVIEGAHVVVACERCHIPTGNVPTFALSAETCLDCHQATAPHGDQFVERTCTSCHNSETFRVPDFDHNLTRFPLDGAHRNGTCDACHLPESDGSGGVLVRYRPLGTECRDCHGESR